MTIRTPAIFKALEKEVQRVIKSGKTWRERYTSSEKFRRFFSIGREGYALTFHTVTIDDDCEIYRIKVAYQDHSDFEFETSKATFTELCKSVQSLDA